MMNDGITSGLIPKHKVISSACPVRQSVRRYMKRAADISCLLQGIRGLPGEAGENGPQV